MSRRCLLCRRTETRRGDGSDSVRTVNLRPVFVSSTLVPSVTKRGIRTTETSGRDPTEWSKILEEKF